MNKELLIRVVVTARGFTVCTTKQLTATIGITNPPVSVLVKQCHEIGALKRVGMRNGATVYTASDNAIQLVKEACDDDIISAQHDERDDMIGMMKVVDKANVKGLGSNKLKTLDNLLKGVRNDTGRKTKRNRQKARRRSRVGNIPE